MGSMKDYLLGRADDEERFNESYYRAICARCGAGFNPPHEDESVCRQCWEELMLKE